MALPLTITVDANSNAVSNPWTTVTNSFTTTPTVNFKSPGATGGSTAASASGGGVDIGMIVELGFFALLFIFVVKEFQR